MGKILGYVGKFDKELLYKMSRSISCNDSKNLEFVSVKNVNIGLVKDSENDQVFYDEKQRLHICLEGDVYVTGKNVNPSTARAIIQLYEQHGVDFLQYLSGPNILIVVDEQKGKMLIVRDKVGERPLFYLRANGNLIFASEIRAILQVDGFKREIDPTALDHFLFFSYIPSPFTIFKGIKKLSPSCFIECGLNGKDFEIKQYWDPSLKVNHGLDEDTWAQIIYNNLVNSTKMMLQKCRAPLGVLLSGGIDSSIIAAILRKLADEDAEIAAFTSSFSDAEYDETFYAKKVAERLNLDHHIQVIEPDHVSKSLPTLAWFFEEPFGGNAVATS
jgi:asparagine synthase (glutamine-hydrolysing)